MSRAVKRQRSKVVPPEISRLRGLPPSERGSALIAMFSIVVGEFAAWVLEHVEAPPKDRARLRRMAGGIRPKAKAKRR